MSGKMLDDRADNWIAQELQTVNFGDLRLDKRLAIMLAAFSEAPNDSIPIACGGRAEVEAAYRFCNNSNVTPQKILQPHYDSTRLRCLEHEVVIVAQDTTECDFTNPHQQVEGARPLDNGSRFGAFCHLSEAFTVEGTPLGAVTVDWWSRPFVKKLSAKEKDKKRREKPIEEKESYRWLTSFRATRQLAQTCSETKFICVSDSESDIYDLLVEQSESNVHWIIRACHDRTILPVTGESPDHLFSELEQQPVMATMTIDIRGREPKVTCDTRSRRTARVNRQGEVALRAGTVTFFAPKGNKIAMTRVTVNAVLVREITPPDGEPPVEWVLLTTLPISSSEEVLDIVNYYKVRWSIEVYFRTLKSGCRIEDRQFETLDRLFVAVTVYLIVAWRVMYVTQLARSSPDCPCEVAFDDSEWQAAYIMTHHKKPLPDEVPTMDEMVKMVAKFGGYLGRGRSRPP